MTPPRVVAGGPQQGGFSGSEGEEGGGQQVAAGAQQEGVERFSIFLMLRIFIRVSGKRSLVCSYCSGGYTVKRRSWLQPAIIAIWRSLLQRTIL
jgi:hypothetical protein